jgi:predicted nucleic acid-binding protein
VDSSVAASYAEIAAINYRSNRKSRARNLDLMIAATAHAHKARLVTANRKDVKHLDHILEIVEIT